MTPTPGDTVYDAAVAAAYDRLLPGLDAEQPDDVALLERFADAATAAGGDVVDVGCGTGRIASWLAARGLRVHGIDPSPAMLAVARAALPEATLSLGSATALPVADGSAAGALAWYSLIHVPATSLATAAAELARVTRPGGVVLVAAQSGAGMREIAGAYGTDATLTAWAHDADALALALGEAGLVVRSAIDRAPRGRERMPQAFVLADRPA